MDSHTRAKNYAGVIAKAWHDPDFKERLKKEPKKVLEENGVSVPDDMEIKVVEDGHHVKHMALPHKPETDDLDHLMRHADAHTMKIITCTV